jgi:hypothetical protein
MCGRTDNLHFDHVIPYPRVDHLWSQRISNSSVRDII